MLGLVKKWLRRHYDAVRVTCELIRQPAEPHTVLFFPSSPPWDAASNLRAWLVAPLLRRLGWRALVVPPSLSLAQRKRLVRMARPDIIVLQQTRHPLNDPRLYHPVPCVLDADDADFMDPLIADDVRARASAAVAVTGGSRYVASGLGAYAPAHYVLWTATPVPEKEPAIDPADRDPIVAWAHSNPLVYPQEAAFLQKVLVGLGRRTRFQFWLFGVTEAAAKDWLAPIRDAGVECTAISPLPYEQYLDKVSFAAVGLQVISPDNGFSKGKSFGKVLAYLAGQVAVVVSNSVDHPALFQDGENGFLADPDVQTWIDRIETLLVDKQTRKRIALAGRVTLDSQLTTTIFARKLDAVLRAHCAQGGGSHLTGENT